MGKNSEIKFIGQPIFKQILNLIDQVNIQGLINIHQSDRYYKVGRNPKGDGKKKGGLKVHMLIDAVQSVGRFIKITAAKVHDKNFLKSLEMISHSMVVFDKAYNYYHQFALWTDQQVYFVTRLKKNAVYTYGKLCISYSKSVSNICALVVARIPISTDRLPIRR